MRTFSLRAALLLAVTAFAASGARAENDVAASLYGAFSGTTNGNGTVQSPSNAAGVLLELRHISNPLIGYEVTYSYNRANQTYTATPVCPVGVVPCSPERQSVSADAHEISGDWIASVHVGRLRPFALAGVGVLINEPVGNQGSTQTQTKPAFIYGAGLDWNLIPHIGLRFQYRGNLYKAPDLTTLYTSTGAFTHTAEPMIGAYFRF